MIAPLGRQPAIAACAWLGVRTGIRARVLGALTTVVVIQFLTCVATEADELAQPAEKQAFTLNSAQGLLSADHTSKFLGARSCAATACHGGIAADPRYPLSQRNEYVFWLDHDPHARAHRTLSNERSRSILKRLARPNESGEIQARRLANCLGCHNPQPAPDQQAATFYPRDGVSCESCHGAAEQWIGAHVAADWRREKTDDPEAWGGGPQRGWFFEKKRDGGARHKKCNGQGG